MWKKFPTQAPKGLRVLLALAVALGLSVNAAVALWIGFHDVLWPVGLSAQLVGLFYFAAGVVSLAGLVAVFPLLGKVLDSTGQPGEAPDSTGQPGEAPDSTGHPGEVPGSTGQPKAGGARHSRLLALITQDGGSSPLATVAAAAVAGLYIDLIIVFYSLHYRTLYVWVFGALALFCACLASVTLPESWKFLGRDLKAVGISLAVLGSAAYFWYQSVYIPENTPTGIYYDLTLGSIVRSGSDRLVSVDLTMENESSVTALTLDSMVEVSGMYPNQKSRILLTLAPIKYDNFLFPTLHTRLYSSFQFPIPGSRLSTSWSCSIMPIPQG